VIQHPLKTAEVSIRADGDHVVMHLRADDTVHKLNATAYAIWGLCDGATTPGEIADAIAELTGIDADTAREQVSAVIDTMARAGLVRL
jgi:hypothetical protein